ncbi:hypothetical protein [Thalassolituus pacificus]|uniref:Uncharacterized protein n=1 Tax=Thalassolituus pacificus TaxID=2975440 RepID=A0A9X2WGB6_9GAMM|nr:hypothetical protein [Thalassolituus pacificus]MCT7359820.1 hypothetical protein [Thalassolituus pacificus]
MEGIIQFLPFWAAYLVSALVGYWCWNRMFFWLAQDSDVRRFLRMIGAVLLFTPAPIAQDSNYFAPVLVVLPFTAINEGINAALYAVSWLLAALCLGVLVLGIRQLLLWLRSRLRTNNEQDEAH